MPEQEFPVAEDVHREILGLSLGDGLETDHRNRDRLDNRRANLRVVSSAGNNQNVLARRGSRSRFRGVHWHKRAGKWAARVQVEGKQKYLGVFESEVDAARVAESFRREHLPLALPDPALKEAMAA